MEGRHCSQMLFLHLPGGTEEAAKNFRPGSMFPGLDVNLGTPQQDVIS